MFNIVYILIKLICEKACYKFPVFACNLYYLMAFKNFLAYGTEIPCIVNGCFKEVEKLFVRIIFAAFVKAYFKGTAAVGKKLDRYRVFLPLF